MRGRMVDAGLWPSDDPRDPSLSIEAAWQIVEEMRESWNGKLAVRIVADPDGYQCDFIALTGHGRIGRALNADSAPLAICLAALKAAGDPEAKPKP